MKKKPIALYVLLFLLAFLSLGAFVGGVPMILDPSGEILQMPVSMIENTSSLPGLSYLLFLGFFQHLPYMHLSRSLI